MAVRIALCAEWLQGSALLIGVGVLVVGCSPQVLLENQGADAEVYVRHWCEERRQKLVRCPDFLSEEDEIFTVEECIEGKMDDIVDACVPEGDEFFRCRVERLSCEEYMRIDTSPGSTCYELLVVWDECNARNGG